MTQEQILVRIMKAEEDIAKSLNGIDRSLKELAKQHTVGAPVQYRVIETPAPHAVRIEGVTDLEGDI